MHYPDLTPYEYFPWQKSSKVVNIGWLEAGHAFNEGDIAEKAIDRLFLFCTHGVNATRGHHLCHFCSKPAFGFRVTRNNRELILGSAEIRVFGKNGIIYAAPNLVYHYVVDHHYRPPGEFIEALLTDPVLFYEPLLEKDKKPWPERMTVLNIPVASASQKPRKTLERSMNDASK